MTGVLIRRDTETNTEGICHVMTEAEIEVIYLQAKHCQHHFVMSALEN